MAVALLAAVRANAQKPGAPAPAPAPAPGAPSKPAPVKAAPAPKSELPKDDVLVINAAGDVAYANGWVGEDVCDAKGVKLFEEVQHLLDEGTLNFVNLETPFTESTGAVDKEYVIVSKPHRLNWLLDAGFNLLSLANNHAVDAGKQGLEDTLALITKANTEARPLWWAGAGLTPEEARKTVVFTPKGKRTKVGFIALGNNGSPLVDAVGSATAKERITALAAEAEVVVVSAHYGREYQHVPDASTVSKYRSFIDAGAKIVFAHHPHVVQGVERYKDGVIFYSLANFSFNSKTKRHHKTGAKLYSMLGRVVLRNGKIDEVRVYPLYANNAEAFVVDKQSLPPKHATPQLLTGVWARQVMNDLIAWTAKIPNAKAAPTLAEIDGESLLVKVAAEPIATNDAR